LENAPVITLYGTSRMPGADVEVWHRFLNWALEVYMPVIMRAPERLGGDTFRIIRESPEYPEIMRIWHLENLTSLEKSRKNPDYGNVAQDILAWQKRGVNGIIWSVVYTLIKSFRSSPAFSSSEQGTRIENAPIALLEAYRLSPDQADKFNRWFSEYAFNIFIPFFMRLQGVRGYDYFKDTGIHILEETRENEYPVYLSMVYFDSIQAFENYEKCPELDSMRKNLLNFFPQGLNFKWWVQYQLEKSWRK
jgi:hypothetical protein